MSREHDYCVYIATNHTQTVLYIGVTSDLEGRLWEHAHGESGSKFTRKYHVNTLLYYEQFGDVNTAIAREKQLKGWSRAKKEALIRTKNPTYADLGPSLDCHSAYRRSEGPSASLHSSQDDRILKRHRHPTTAITLGGVHLP